MNDYSKSTDWLLQWSNHNEEWLVKSNWADSDLIEVYPPQVEYLDENNYIGTGKYMVPWIHRHTDTSIRVNEKGNFESKQTDITIFKETVYVSYMYDIVIRHNEDTKLVDTSHHERSAYSWILARNGVTSTKDYANAIYLESRKCTVRHNKKYALVINTRWSSTNYYHWIHENLPRLQILRKKFGNFEDFYLIWLGAQKPMKYHTDTLRLLGINLNRINYYGGCISIDRLVHPTFCNPGGFNKNQIKQIKNISTSLETDIRAKKKILIMRKEGSARELIRNETVNELIEKYKFIPVLLENLSISEQVLLMKEAKVVIAPHGAGLTNCIHMNEGCSLIEIMPSDSIHPLYWYLSSLANLKYSMMPVSIKGKKKQELEISKCHTCDILEEHGIKL